MLVAYFNYPTSRVSLHTNVRCGHIPPSHRAPARSKRIEMANLSLELQAFRDKQYKFQSSAGTNDMWLVVELGDPIFERAVVEAIVRSLALHYKPFRDAHITEHC